jgi:hypothetical protein
MVGRVLQVAATPMTREGEQARLFEKHRREISENVAENRAKLEELKRVASSIRILVTRVKHDSADRYGVEVDLELANALYQFQIKEIVYGL